MYDILIVFCLLKNVFSRSRSNFLDFDEENQQIYCMLVRNDINNKTGKGGVCLYEIICLSQFHFCPCID